MKKYSIDTKKYINKMIEACKKSKVNLDLKNPKTIQDKLAWLNIYEPDTLKCDCADKVKVHEYCKEKLGKDLCIPILKVYNSAKEIKFDELPDKFVLKCNHGSGMNIVVRDKSKLDKKDAIEKLNKWMSRDFAFQNGFEAHYHDIKKKIFAEKYMKKGTQESDPVSSSIYGLSAEQCTAHGFELLNLLPEDVLRQLKVLRQAGKAVELLRAPVDHFPGHGDIILYKRSAAADAADRLSHGRAPSCTGTASYRGRVRWG